jgi:ABC-2 type transport system permease protein
MADVPAAAPGRLPGAGALLAAQLRYQIRLLAGGRAIIIGIGLPVLLLLASNTARGHPGDSVTAGYAALGLTMTAWNIYGVRLCAAREAGVLKRWRSTPLPRWVYFVGRILSTVLVAVVAGAATVLASVLLFSTHLSAQAIVGTLIALVLGGLAWASSATALTAAIPTVEAAAPTFMVIYFPAIIVSGVFGAIHEPHWLYTIASYLPAQPLINAITVSLHQTASGSALPPARDLIVMAAWTVAGLAASVFLFRWEPHKPAQRRQARTSVPRPFTEPTSGASLDR